MTSDLTAIGLMSGTSMDAIDVALIRSDGERIIAREAFSTFPYSDAERRLLQEAMRNAADIQDRESRPGSLSQAEDLITRKHAEIVDSFLQDHGLSDSKIDVIGFHGQTILHRPEIGLTLQLGDGDILAKTAGIPVINDMRHADMENGGQGAPLACAYHAALAAGLDRTPVVFVNIGGVGNVTWIGDDGGMLAFDTGPGNALMDDWAQRHLGVPVDKDGMLARSGEVSDEALALYLHHPYFDQPAPKSLDRGDFHLGPLEEFDISAADGMATLAQVTASSIARATRWFPEPPQLWVICGGGRHNPFLMELLDWHLEAPVRPAEAFGLNGDAIEAEAWAFLATRSLKGLPLTYPGTTGVREPMTGGVLHAP